MASNMSPSTPPPAAIIRRSSAVAAPGASSSHVAPAGSPLASPNAPPPRYPIAVPHTLISGHMSMSRSSSSNLRMTLPATRQPLRQQVLTVVHSPPRETTPTRRPATTTLQTTPVRTPLRSVSQARDVSVDVSAVEAKLNSTLRALENKLEAGLRRVDEKVDSVKTKVDELAVLPATGKEKANTQEKARVPRRSRSADRQLSPAEEDPIDPNEKLTSSTSTSALRRELIDMKKQLQSLQVSVDGELLDAFRRLRLQTGSIGSKVEELFAERSGGATSSSATAPPGPAKQRATIGVGTKPGTGVSRLAAGKAEYGANAAVTAAVAALDSRLQEVSNKQDIFRRHVDERMAELASELLLLVEQRCGTLDQEAADIKESQATVKKELEELEQDFSAMRTTVGETGRAMSTPSSEGRPASYSGTAIAVTPPTKPVVVRLGEPEQGTALHAEFRQELEALLGPRDEIINAKLNEVNVRLSRLSGSVMDLLTLPLSTRSSEVSSRGGQTSGARRCLPEAATIFEGNSLAAPPGGVATAHSDEQAGTAPAEGSREEARHDDGDRKRRSTCHFGSNGRHDSTTSEGAEDVEGIVQPSRRSSMASSIRFDTTWEPAQGEDDESMLAPLIPQRLSSASLPAGFAKPYTMSDKGRLGGQQRGRTPTRDGGYLPPSHLLARKDSGDEAATGRRARSADSGSTSQRALSGVSWEVPARLSGHKTSAGAPEPVPSFSDVGAMPFLGDSPGARRVYAAFGGGSFSAPSGGDAADDDGRVVFDSSAAAR
eukprot:TRINITY_DN29981_c0_g1_i1.p1 TRINITY_DN29981_c0_g1~~TRINITY_DN29981_c0_g1_i1.p1  ORF type:complete len:799 (+),score=141.67 TRINITY_DN29981_c0_g1_i1:79-2397(+)